MKITINSQIIVENPNKEVKDYCQNKLTIKNPEIQRRQAMGFWAGNVEKNIKMYTINENKYVLPMGCIDDIYEIDNNLSDYNIEFKEHKKLDFPKSNITPYPYQEKAIQEMIKVKRGILVAKCRCWKKYNGIRNNQKIRIQSINFVSYTGIVQPI